jgi:hypothetical protein
VRIYRSWGEFSNESNELAEAGLALLYQGSGIASAFLATVAPDQGPRVHPVFPIVAAGNLWLFIVDISPKYRDLKRNGLFALHTQLTANGGEEFYLRGRADQITDSATRERVVESTRGRQGSTEFEALFCCELESVLYTRWKNWGTAETWPVYSKWRARSNQTEAGSP